MALNFGRRAAVGAGVLAVVVSLVCVRLGFWQLDRLEERRALNAVIARGSALPEVLLDAPLLDSISANPALFSYRAVRAEGGAEGPSILVRGRALAGRPGVHLIAPLSLEGGSLLIVNQGWLPSADGATADPRPYALQGPQTLVGRLMPLGDGAGDAVRSELDLQGYPVTAYLRLDRTALAQEFGRVPEPVILQLTERPSDTAELPVPLPLPELNDGPHLGYAIQWFSFAVISLGGFLIMVFLRRRTGPNRVVEGS